MNFYYKSMPAGKFPAPTGNRGCKAEWMERSFFNGAGKQTCMCTTWACEVGARCIATVNSIRGRQSATFEKTPIVISASGRASTKIRRKGWKRIEPGHGCTKVSITSDVNPDQVLSPTSSCRKFRSGVAFRDESWWKLVNERRYRVVSPSMVFCKVLTALGNGTSSDNLKETRWGTLNHVLPAYGVVTL